MPARDCSDSNSVSRVLRSISGIAPMSSPSRFSRSKMKYASPAALPASDAVWIIPNDVVPSGKTPHNSPSRPGPVQSSPELLSPIAREPELDTPLWEKFDRLADVVFVL